MCPSYCQISALNLSVSGLSAHPVPQFSCLLSLAGGWGSKLQILKDPVECCSHPLTQRRTSQAVPSTILSQKSSHSLHRCLESMVNSGKSCNQVICPLCAPLSPFVEQPFSGVQEAFCPWRCKISSSKCTPGKRGRSLSLQPRVSLHHSTCENSTRLLPCSLLLSLT